jgi:hypothetical protein
MNIAALIVVPVIIVVFICSAYNIKPTTVRSNEPSIIGLAKSAQDASRAALEAVKLAQSASQSAEASMKSAAESAKSAEAAAKSVRDFISKRPSVSSPAPINASNLAEIQRGLLLLGFDAGPVDAKAGRRTKKAARAFCAQIGIEFKSYQDQTFRDALTSRLKNEDPAAR